MERAEDGIRPGTARLMGASLQGTFTPAYWGALGVATGLGGLAGHAAGEANLAGQEASRLVANFEAYLGVLLLLALGIFVITRLADGGGPAWLHPLHARGLPREAYPLAVMVCGVGGAGLFWTVTALGYRWGWAMADSWAPGPAVARMPIVWAALVLVAAYAASCAALTRSTGRAISLAVGFPVAFGVAMVQYVLHNPELAMPPMWMRLPGLFMPPLGVEPNHNRALQHLLSASLMLAPLILLSPRWTGRTT